MREIKFRAWWIGIDCKTGKLARGKAEGEMAYNPSTFWAETINDALSSDGSVIFMQYTGLKDRNNVEVYEGDIICEVGRKASGEKIEWRYEVCFGIYDNGEDYDDRTAGNGWYLNSIPRGYVSDFMNIDGFERKLQVIGNIYENPELLKGG